MNSELEKDDDSIREYLRWRSQNCLDTELKTELASIENDLEQIKERFYKSLEFGTAGLRGIIGAGTNRMNIPVVRRATLGLADYILGFEGGARRGVAIAYDSRNKSRVFAETAALTLCEAGIKAYLYDSLRPVPMLSYAVRLHDCIAGIVITASHNTREYNGYKVYWQDGGQVNPTQAKAIYECIIKRDYFEKTGITIDEARQSGLLTMLSEADDEPYYRDTLSVLQAKELLSEHGDEVKIVYTPLHGSGNKPVRNILARAGLSNVYTVAEQQEPDGDFPTVKAPNPEDPNVFSLAVELAKKVGADIIIATDPDADRMGLALRDKDGEYRTLSGNKIGCLLLYYILSAMRRREGIPKDGFAVKSIVSSRLADEICAHFGIRLINTPTGFRFISEAIERSRITGEGTFIFGFEESYGFLAGGYSRDKDAVCAALIAAEACAYYKTQGKTLLDAMDEIGAICGHFTESAKSYTLGGMDGMRRMADTMRALRQDSPREFGGISVEIAEDMLSGTAVRLDGDDKTPLKSEVAGMDALRFLLSGGAWVCIRPSGTEPKLKLYVGANAKTEEEARLITQRITNAADERLNVLMKG